MCLISEKIKFCSCNVHPPHLPQNYWVFYRFNAGKSQFVFGQTLRRNPLLEDLELLNKDLLLERLQEEDAFDKPLHAAEKDRLLLRFVDSNDNLRQLTLTYEFRGGHWLEAAYEPLNWTARHDQAVTGSMEQPFE